jgi:hypothetical protein
MKTAVISAVLALLLTSNIRADEWKNDKIWYDGLVEKAVYSASHVVYGKPRAYEATFIICKEKHDRATLTKADKSTDTIEVWKFNQVEDIPTPNYTYHYLTTVHLSTKDWMLTRLDCGESEWCGASFKQIVRLPDESGWDYRAFSYMPEAGAVRTKLTSDKLFLPVDSLPLALRDFDFAAKKDVSFATYRSQKSNQQTVGAVMSAVAHFAGEDANGYKLQVSVDGQLFATYWFANDRLHVMTRFEASDRSQTYELKSVDRVNYWTIKGE